MDSQPIEYGFTMCLSNWSLLSYFVGNVRNAVTNILGASPFLDNEFPDRCQFERPGCFHVFCAMAKLPTMVVISYIPGPPKRGVMIHTEPPNGPGVCVMLGRGPGIRLTYIYVGSIYVV